MVENACENLICASVKDQEGNNDLRLLFMPLNLSGLHIKGFRCNAMTVGCFGFHEPACAVGGLPINLLLLEAAVGVASTVVSTLDVRHTLCGSHTNDCRPKTQSVLSLALELFSGVGTMEFGSGRKVAMEACLLG